MLMVSHDRHLLRTTVDSFWIVADGQVQEFDGDLDDYRDWLAQRAADARTRTRQEIRREPSTSEPERQTELRQPAPAPQRRAERPRAPETKIHTAAHGKETTQHP